MLGSDFTRKKKTGEQLGGSEGERKQMRTALDSSELLDEAGCVLDRLDEKWLQTVIRSSSTSPSSDHRAAAAR